MPLGYVLGSIPFAFLVARFRGVDVFRVGTRNPGAANVFRTVGRAAGGVVLLCDVGKGVAAVVLARWAGVSPWLAFISGNAALVGHWYPVLLGFRGGAGLAVTIGVAYGMIPLASFVATPLALLLLYFTRNTGVSAAAGFSLLAMSAPFLAPSTPIPLVLAIAAQPVLALARERLLPTPGV